MIKHEKLLHEKWDVLIILDACRYDKFVKVLPEIYEKGELFEGNSQASSTSSWLRKHWKLDDGTYHSDIIYISGNPFINSLGVTLPSNEYFNALDFFGEVVDGWDFGFNKKTGRIEPGYIALLSSQQRFLNPNMRFIIHFMQPHAPYLFSRKKPEPINLLKRILPKKLISKIRPMVPKKVRKDNIHQMEFNYSRIYSRKQIIEAYEKNLKSVEIDLKWVLNEVFKNKRIIITSDHAEYLGENGRYGHGGRQNSIITSVPVCKIGFD